MLSHCNTCVLANVENVCTTMPDRVLKLLVFSSIIAQTGTTLQGAASRQSVKLSKIITPFPKLTWYPPSFKTGQRGIP